MENQIKPIKVKAINHVGLVVTDLAASKHFYSDILGFGQHKKIDSWLLINESTFLHLIDIEEAGKDDSIYHEVQHFAMEVEDIHVVKEVALHYQLNPFQMDFTGKEKKIESIDDDLSFGIGTIFVADPDGNLIEFLQLGKGVFKEN